MLASLSEFLAVYNSIIRNESNKVLRLGWYSHNHSHIICHIVADIIRDFPDTLRRSGAIYYRKEMMLSEIDGLYETTTLAAICYQNSDSGSPKEHTIVIDQFHKSQNEPVQYPLCTFLFWMGYQVNWLSEIFVKHKKFHYIEIIITHPRFNSLWDSGAIWRWR